MDTRSLDYSSHGFICKTNMNYQHSSPESKHVIPMKPYHFMPAGGGLGGCCLASDTRTGSKGLFKLEGYRPAVWQTLDGFWGFIAFSVGISRMCCRQQLN